jgi:class I fructose-bisphosphate aldolase
MILPIDQILEHGPGRAFEPNPIMYDPLEQAQFAVDGGFNAFAAPLGSLERGFEVLARHNVPTILKVNSHNLMIPDEKNPRPSIHSWVGDAVRLGCEAVGFTLYPGSIHSNQIEQQAKELIADARKAGLITVLWIYPRGEGLIKGQERAVDIIAYAVALGASLGAHIIKVKLPLEGYGLESNKKLGIYGKHYYRFSDPINKLKLYRKFKDRVIISDSRNYNNESIRNGALNDIINDINNVLGGIIIKPFI